MKIKDLSILFILAIIWGSSFLFIRISGPEFGPFLTVELRVLIAVVVLWLYTLWIRYRLEILKRWKEFLIIGALNAAIPFVLITTAELYISASLAAILNATTPLFTALVAWGWNKERMGFLRIIGLFMGFFGVGILVSWSPVPFNMKLLYSTLFSLLAALSYAFAGVYTVRKLKNVKPLDIAIGQQLGASVLLIPFALSTLPDHMPSMTAIASILGLALLCTSFAYILYFYLMHSIGPVKTVSVTFLVPIFGIFWSVIFLKEAVYMNTIIGLATILSSIVLVMNLLPQKTKKLATKKS